MGAATKVEERQQSFDAGEPRGAAPLAKVVDPKDLAGQVFSEIDTINANLKAAHARCNLIAPQTRVGTLLPGTSVMFDVLYVNPTVNDFGSGPDCYKLDGGKLGLNLTVLDRIAGALGASWDPDRSRRTDDGKTLRYWTYKVVGTVVQFDGSDRTVEDEYEWDVRDESERVREARAKAEANAKRYPKDAEKIRWKCDTAISVMRKFGYQRAISGARARALSRFGVRRSYTAEELSRPFVVARLHFDARSDDPAIQAIMAQRVADKFLGVRGMLYPSAAPAPSVNAGPSDNVVDAPQPQPEPQGTPKPLELPDKDNTPIHEATDFQLAYWAQRIEDDWGVYPEEEREDYEQLRQAVMAEQARRKSESEKF